MRCSRSRAAVDAVVQGSARNAFCPVRPPGHHAGPRGVVTCERDPDGSHGFCLLNNVAIGAAYAMHVSRAARRGGEGRWRGARRGARVRVIARQQRACSYPRTLQPALT